MRGWLRLAGLAWMWTCLAAWADLEATFPVLTIGTQTYKNVTVTTKAKKYIFILHSEGMANIKVADLPPDLLTNLGYAAPVAANAPATGAAGWTKQALAKIELPQVRAMDWQIAKDWSRRATDGSLRLPQPDTTTLLAILGVGLALYMFGCYCCLLLCQTAGYEPGPVIWVPVLQMIPLFRAAEMSGWWVLGCFVPGLNLLAHILRAGYRRWNPAWGG